MRILRRNGLEPLGPFFTMCQGEIVHLYEDELWQEIEAGFQGTVIVPGWAARSIDLARLRSRAGVQVLILPEGAPLGHS